MPLILLVGFLWWQNTANANMAAETQLLKEANDHYRAFHFRDAVRLYRLYLTRYLDRADIRVYLGGALLNLNQPELALQEAQHAVALNPDFAKSYVLLGRIYTSAASWDLAEQSFSQALQLEKNDREAWYFAGRAAYEANRFEQAIVRFDQALRLGAVQSRTYENLALSYEALGEIKQAETMYQTAVRLADHQYRPHLAYGVFLFKQGRSVECLQLLQRAYQLEPNSVDVCLELARVLYHLKKFEEAVQILESASKWNDCRVYNLSAKVLSMQGRKEAAMAQVEQLKTCLYMNASQAADSRNPGNGAQ